VIDRDRYLPQNPSLSNVSSEHTHWPLLQTLFAMTHTPLSRQGPLRRPLATEKTIKNTILTIIVGLPFSFNGLTNTNQNEKRIIIDKSIKSHNIL